MDVDPIVNEILEWGKSEYIKWFGNRPWTSTTQKGQIIDQRPGMMFIVSGYNEQTDKRSLIYLLNSALDFAARLCVARHMLAGVPQYTIYLMHRLYNPQMKLVNVRALAVYLITETATQAPKVGGPLRMAEISLEKGYQGLSEDLIQSIIKKNDEQKTRLCEFFFTRRGR